MRVRIALGLALLATLIGFLIDMSGSAPRLAGSDHVHWPALNPGVAVAPPHTAMCVVTVLPSDTARIELAIHGAPRLPRIAVTFADLGGRRLATGVVSAGVAESSDVSIALHHAHAPSVAGNLCLRAGGKATLVYDGTAGSGGTTVAGVAAAGSPAILFYRAGSESWWSLLGTLDRRFGLGKSSIFGDWALVVIALAALALFGAVARLLVRELR